MARATKADNVRLHDDKVRGLEGINGWKGGKHGQWDEIDGKEGGR